MKQAVKKLNASVLCMKASLVLSSSTRVSHGCSEDSSYALCVLPAWDNVQHYRIVCSLVYVVEVAVRLIVVGPVVYFRKWWNRLRYHLHSKKTHFLKIVHSIVHSRHLCVAWIFKCSVDFVLVTGSFFCLCVEAMLYTKYPVTGYLSVVRPLVVLRWVVCAWGEGGFIYQYMHTLSTACLQS